ncbi:RHS repeat-associated core domain-containing protein [Micromonospora chokoriensis]|uniref:Intein N-terminal splicing region/RHS repeat-associated core domain-containing protein n=1 Tax=Micromonospora chokoriensis TaxID=356851 RepID=A0A1C4ZBK5_9ACTN|nr:RHS repeat-associated core domain-containing protein [Micromonospora chokoriensis]SCF30121.1 intein N-terminal splicing region/RHS repeat-associated core domain-containing protein [Micromonospora chokoriensis]
MRGIGLLSRRWHGRRTSTEQGRRARTAMVLFLSTTLVATSVPAPAWAVPGAGMSREDTQVQLPDIPKTKQVGQDGEAETALLTADEVPVVPYKPGAVKPWQQDSGVVDLTGVEPGVTKQVDDLPVSLGVPEGGDPAALAGTWTVDLAAPEASQAASVSGLIMKISPPATADPAAEVALDVNYSEFADLYGPLAADRFGVMLLPDCVFDAPDSGDCATAGSSGMTASAPATASARTVPSEVTLVPTKKASARIAATADEPMQRVVSGKVPVGALLAAQGAGSGPGARAAAAEGSSVVGVLDTGASAAGDFTATPLLSSGSWAAGSSSGAFTYSYQVQTPETAAGLMPKVALSYSSQSVDGRTSATNNQASWIGDGWDYSAGAITRSYASCREDSKKPGANNSSHRTADLCWGSKNNATLSLAGMTTELVWDEGKKAWFTANGDGSKVELVKDTSLANGDADGEYWIVTTRDGTRYHFGRNRLPGWSDRGSAADDPVTNSVLTVPVYGNHSDEDCYKAGNWAGSVCTQAWRWSLDYVEDIHGNAMSLWWERETNHYARNFNFKDPVSYDRGGYLTRIDYGQRRDTLFSEAPLARIAFSVAERCFAEGSLTCTDENFASAKPDKYRIWYDTPADLRCAAGQKCWNASPSFFTRKRLDKITTSAQRTSAKTLQTVDEYQLKQSFPILKTGPNTALWLESITRTGHGRNNDKIALNAVRFESNTEEMPNRVKRDNRPGFARLRIARVINEYGGETVINYKAPVGDCDKGTGLPGKSDTAALKANDRFCYPAFWHPDPAVEDIDWFQKYVVDSVEELPNLDGAFTTTTRYAYGTPAWRLAEQEFTKKSTRTYSQFAGVDQVTVYTGADDPDIGSKRTKSVTRYFRGLGDNVSVRDVTEAEIAKDREAFAGRVAEELTYADAGDADTNWLTRSVTYPAAQELASRTRDDGLSPLKAWRVTEPRQASYTRSSGTGDDTRTLRTVETRTKFDEDSGLPELIESLGDTDKTGDESCTEVHYLNREDKNLIGLTKQIRTSPTTCADATFDDLKTLSSAGRVAYDGQAYDVALGASTRGLATQTWSLKGDGTGFQPDGTTGFDAIGRVVSNTDPDGKTSKITYTPSTGQATSVTEENSLGHKQTRELDPGRAVTVKTTDLNNRVSEAKYDALGRLVEAWGPGRTPSSAAVPDFRAQYVVPAGKPPVITTFSRGHENRIQTSVTIYDGLGRERQTQEEATGGGRLITDTEYNSSGEVWRTNNAYLANGSPGGQLFTPFVDPDNPGPVPNATLYTYDGLGRVTQELPVLNGVEQPNRATRYVYGADHSTVVNPAGATSYRMFTDALGRTTRVDTFTNSARTEFTSMRYQHDARGQLAQATHSASPTRPWTWTYDQRGRMDSSTDPDSGTTRITYDHRDRQLTSTNARGVTVWNGYDQLSRPTSQRLGSSTGTLLGEFTYDTVANGKGLPASATRYTDGLPYTQRVNSYSDDYQPTSTTLTLPQSIADTWGLRTSYTYDSTYTDTGLPESSTLPAVGSLPSEKLLVRYTKDGLPLSVSGNNWYGAETVYSPYGQVLRSTLGAQPYRVWTMASYDDASGALNSQQVYREQTGDKSIVGGNLVSNRSYAYDDAGNVLAIREEATGIEERQCFQYALGRLKTAWTAKNQALCSPGPVNTDGTLNVAAGTDKSGYWQEYEYDLLGNRTKLVEKDLTGATAKDATTTYTYGKADGSQPRTLTKATKNYLTPAGAAITAAAERLYELTGETKSVTSLQNGDQQTLSWTYDGQVERIAGEGTKGRSPYVGLADKCLDLSNGLAVPNQPLMLYPCNESPAQKWAFAATPNQSNPNLGTLAAYDTWCVQPAANTAGSVFAVQSCTGAAGQQVERLSTGQLKHTASGLCVAVKDAATADGTPIVLAACATVPAQQWEAQDETRHIYGPGGTRLLTIQQRQATLNLGEAQLTVQRGGVQVSVQRSYAVPGGTVVRYANRAVAGSHLLALAGDHQGSTYAEVGMYDTAMPVRIRKQDPFGNQRGSAPLAVNMQNNTGFLGAVRDDASGFTPLGARLYDPTVGRFLSADPVLDLADPAQSNGYAYAHNNPVTHSDPSGLSVALTASETAAALAGAGLSAAMVSQAQANMGRSLMSVVLDSAWYILKEFIGINDAMNCFGGDMWACGSLIIGAIPWAKLGKIPAVMRAVNRTIDAIQAWRAAKRAAEAVLAAARAAETAALNAKKLAIERAKKAAQAAKKKAADKVNTTSNKATQASKKTGNPVQKQAQAKGNPKGSSAGSSGAGKSGGNKSSGGAGKGDAKPGGASGASGRSSGGTSGGGGAGKPDGECLTNSFVPGTKVLMADGSTKPIEDVEPGDKVQVTDPETGRVEVETVTAAITGEGVKNLVKVTIDTDGEQGSDTAEVTATDGHPFWVPELNEWVDATDLRTGQMLRTSAGTLVQITAIERWTTEWATVHNLTVANIHTYYVIAGDAPVLVHNCRGKATVRWDEDMEHATIRVEGGGRSLETEQVIPGWDGVGSPNGLPTTGARAESLGPNVIERTFDVPDVGAAMRAQQSSIGADLGGYDGIHNSCVTYCVSILRAGGVDIPAGARGMVALKRTLG